MTGTSGDTGKLAMDFGATTHAEILAAGTPHVTLHQWRQQHDFHATMGQAIPYLAPVLCMMPLQGLAEATPGLACPARRDGSATAEVLGAGTGAAIGDPGALVEGAPPPSPGSVGHPELCSRPCIFFASNTCANGAACPFCHGLHPKRPVHLDKRNRAVFEKMSPEARAALLLGLISLKVKERDPSSRAQQLLQALAAAVGVPLEMSPQTTGKREGALRCALSSMSLRPLLSTLARTAWQNAPDVVAISEDLLRHCRCSSGDPLSPA